MGFANPNNWFAGSNDPTAATNMNGGQAVQPGQLAYQGVSPGKGQNSLEQYMRSLTNLGGQTAQSALQTGMGNTNTAGNYYSGVLQGGAGTAQALTPEIMALRSNTANATRNLSQFAPSGGGRASMLSQMPYQQGGVIANLISQARGNAAGSLGQLGLGQAAQGGNLLQMILGSLGQGRGQDVMETGQNKALGASLAGEIVPGMNAYARLTGR